MKNPAPNSTSKKKQLGAWKICDFPDLKLTSDWPLGWTTIWTVKCDRGGGLNSESGWFISCDTNKTTHRSMENYLHITQRHGIELIWYNSTIEVTSFAARTWTTPCPLSYHIKISIELEEASKDPFETVWSLHFKWNKQNSPDAFDDFGCSTHHDVTRAWHVYRWWLTRNGHLKTCVNCLEWLYVLEMSDKELSIFMVSCFLPWT